MLTVSYELIRALNLNWKGLFLVRFAKHANLIRFSVWSLRACALFWGALSSPVLSGAGRAEQGSHRSVLDLRQRKAREAAFLQCGVQGDYKLSGAAAVGTKLPCTPCSALPVLTTGAAAGAVRTAPCGACGE